MHPRNLFNTLSTRFMKHVPIGELKTLFQLQGGDLFQLPIADKSPTTVPRMIDPILYKYMRCSQIEKIRAMDAACAKDFEHLNKINAFEQEMRRIPSKAAKLKELHDELRESIICAYATELQKQKIEPPKMNANAKLALMIEDVYEHMLDKEPTILKPLLKRAVVHYVTTYTHIWGGHTVRMSPYSNQPKPI